MLRVLSHVPGKAEAVRALRWSRQGWPGCVPASPLPARELQPTWAAHVSAVPARATQRPLPPETAPLIASAEERADLLITLKRSFSANIQWLMVEQDNKASHDEKACKKATQPSSGNRRLLISRGEEGDNQNSNF